MNPVAPVPRGAPPAGAGIEAEVESILIGCEDARLDDRIEALARIDERLRACLDSEASK